MADQDEVFNDYLWQDGTMKNTYLVNKACIYTVQVSNACGQGNAEILITEKICNILFPSDFTPNKDGKNETFRILNVPVLTDFSLSVFNRRGRKVFETKDDTKGWDGTMNGIPAPEGAYMWFCRFKNPEIPQTRK